MNLRLSYYTIFSDPVNVKNDRVCYSTLLGKTNIISEYCYECLVNNFIDEIPATIIADLIEKKILVEERTNELELAKVIQENKASIESANMLSEIIQPSAMCQLGCYYCGQSHTKDYLSDALIDKICIRIENKLASKKFKGLAISWFGAEPLMGLKQMRLISKRLKSFCLERGLKYKGKVVTNGLSLKPNIFKELATELNVTGIEITLDGTKEFHDEHRYMKKGGGSFDLILKNLVSITHLDNFRDLGCNISVRCNVDEKNPEGVLPLIKLLKENGLDDKISYFYPVGIYSWAGNDAQKKSLTKEGFAKRELGWMIDSINHGLDTSISIPQRRKIVCMSVANDAEMVDAFGNVFNCTEVSYTDFYENTPHVLGNLKQNAFAEFKAPPLKDWNDKVLQGKFPCSTCRLLPVCGGRCPKSWEEGLEACPPFKYNIRERLKLLYITEKTSGEEKKQATQQFLKDIDSKNFTRVT